MTVVEHTAGTWPCLPSAHHFLPEPAESVVFSQAITQEQREPDHSVDLFLVWRIFCKNQNCTITMRWDGDSTFTVVSVWDQEDVTYVPFSV